MERQEHLQEKARMEQEMEEANSRYCSMFTELQTEFLKCQHLQDRVQELSNELATLITSMPADSRMQTGEVCGRPLQRPGESGVIAFSGKDITGLSPIHGEASVTHIGSPGATTKVETDDVAPTTKNSECTRVIGPRAGPSVSAARTASPGITRRVLSTGRLSVPTARPDVSGFGSRPATVTIDRVERAAFRPQSRTDQPSQSVRPVPPNPIRMQSAPSRPAATRIATVTTRASTPVRAVTPQRSAVPPASILQPRVYASLGPGPRVQQSVVMRHSHAPNSWPVGWRFPGTPLQV
mmetsp:Transcript_24935/g.60385  ORF Transcript_24935/g.60385 Transcript_24935/m.60385 type:complete len:295 (+) Transcript_24935:68-952(+)